MRTEQQAASREETAAAMDEITATVRSTAEGAARASHRQRDARRGGAGERCRPRLRGRRLGSARARATRRRCGARRQGVHHRVVDASAGRRHPGQRNGQALQRIVERIVEINGLVSQIAASAEQQASGLQ